MVDQSNKENQQPLVPPPHGYSPRLGRRAAGHGEGGEPDYDNLTDSDDDMVHYRDDDDDEGA